MTIQDWGAIGEMIGGVAVVASLVYLAMQIRQNTQQISRSIEAEKHAALERNIESANRIREMLIRDRELAGLFQSGMKDYVSLSKNDKFRFGLLMRNTFSEFQGA